jgi:ankyrin repeat protein
LHLAVCCGHGHLVSLLLDHGANYVAVGELTGRGLPTFAAAEDHGITALHSAALRGNVAMCELLLDHHTAGVTEGSDGMLEREDARGLRALDYAVAAGHTRTAGSWYVQFVLFMPCSGRLVSHVIVLLRQAFYPGNCSRDE